MFDFQENGILILILFFINYPISLDCIYLSIEALGLFLQVSVEKQKEILALPLLELRDCLHCGKLKALDVLHAYQIKVWPDPCC